MKWTITCALLCAVTLMGHYVLYKKGRKEEKDMAEVYATLIIKGVKTYAQVPAVIKPKVKAVLEALDLGELATEE